LEINQGGKCKFTESFLIFTVLRYRMTPSGLVQRQRYSFAPGRCPFWISAQDKDSYDWLSSWFYSVPSGKWWDSTLNKLLPVSFKLLSVHKSPAYNVKFSFVNAVKAMGKRRCRSALDGDELLASHPGCFNPTEEAHGTHFIGGYVDPTGGLAPLYPLCFVFLGFCGDVVDTLFFWDVKLRPAWLLPDVSRHAGLLVLYSRTEKSRITSQKGGDLALWFEILTKTWEEPQNDYRMTKMKKKVHVYWTGHL
jgi:hypothetical protein